MHDLYRQSFGNATLSFVSIKVQIFLWMSKKSEIYLHNSEKSCTFVRNFVCMRATRGISSSG